MENLDYMSALREGQWTLQASIENVPLVAEQGFTHQIVGPLQGLKEDCTLSTCPWWLPYQVTNLKIGNIYGDLKDLEKCAREGERYGVETWVDVVFTHLAQDGPGSPKPHSRCDPELTSNPYFLRPAISLRDAEYDDRSLVTHLCAGGLPGMNLYNWEYQDKVFKFIESLANCGVTGIRCDSGKNIPLPNETYDRDRIVQKILQRAPEIDRMYLSDAFCDPNPSPFLDRWRNFLEKKKLKLMMGFEILNVPTGWLFDQYANYGYMFVDHRDHSHPKAIISPETHDQYWNPDPHHQNQGEVSHMPDYVLSKCYESMVRVDGKNYFLWNSRPFSDEWKGENIRRANQILREKVYSKQRKVS